MTFERVKDMENYIESGLATKTQLLRKIQITQTMVCHKQVTMLI